MIFSYQLDKHSAKYANLINEKDLEQVTAVKQSGLKYLVSYDKHFEGLEEYVTPRQFVELLGLRARPVNH